MQEPKQAFWIISAERKDLTRQLNWRRTKALAAWLEHRGADFKYVVGAYNGVVEHSLVVLDNGKVLDVDLLRVAQLSGQECVLYVDETRRASLVYVGGPTERIGAFTPVSSRPRGRSRGWTYDPANRQYYTVE